uniref:2'-5'-oligoadenylate synthase 1A isoform X2 n=1 Tax=Jaculus jaculus TaxID=51337 RepID=UPI001E1B5C86|nr:2'-5'-oligoadenylate synthase 1A isoform X2 [Jaculus jaculus]
MALRKTPARDLDKFIEEHLLPDTDFSRRVRAAVGTLCAFLKERCFRNASHPVRVSKVVKGGSSGKGTALRGRSDADLVVFLNNLTSFDEQFNRRAEFLEEIKKQLEACQREQQFRVIFKVQSPWWFWWFTPRALSFTLSDPYLQQEVEFDVLLAYDALGHSSKYSKPEPHIYARLIHECTNLKREGEFSTCFTELQRSFLKQRPPKLKSLIRLVKHWYQLCKEKLGNPLPPQYALELLTVHAWERGCGETYFNTAEGFKTVLQLVMEYQKLCVYWTVYYDFNDQFISDYLYRQLQKTRPVILDPADPTGNVASEDLDGWQRLAGEAEAWLQYPCFKNWDGSPVGFWNVPVRSLPESFPADLTTPPLSGSGWPVPTSALQNP